MEVTLGRIPIRVRPGFVLVAAFLGSASRDPREVALWVAVAFVSILLHELGHAAMGRALGQSPSILIYEAGGLTSFAPGGEPVGAAGQIAISLAGPFAGLLLGGCVYLASRGLAAHLGSPLATLFTHDMLYCNVGWGLLNLLPILPLDGGNVAKRVLVALHAPSAERNARVLSIAVAVAGTAWAALHGSWFLAIYAASFAGLNIQALRAAAPAPASPPPPAP